MRNNNARNLSQGRRKRKRGDKPGQPGIVQPVDIRKLIGTIPHLKAPKVWRIAMSRFIIERSERQDGHV